MRSPFLTHLLAACLPPCAAASAAHATEMALAAVTFSLPAIPLAQNQEDRPAPPQTSAPLPHYDFWLARLSLHPRPSRADEFLPRLRAAFAAEGVPPALVWLVETESAFDPRARSPAGARGLFQLMPDTARSLGLDLRPDERIHPVRSARAAAAYLRYLHDRFGDWPLALAAYNAGESRVARELRRSGADDFGAIAARLPAETRYYVPRVLATVQVREGVPPHALDPPLAR